MFRLNDIWESVYANVDAVNTASQERVQRQVRISFNNVIPLALWRAYTTIWSATSDANGLVYLPSDLARPKDFKILLDTEVKTPLKIHYSSRCDQQYLQQYRIAFQGVDVSAATADPLYPQTYSGGSTVTLIDDDADIDGGAVSGTPAGFDANFGLWARFEGETNPRSLRDSDTLTERYRGTTTGAIGYVANPNRLVCAVFAPGETEPSEDIQVQLQYVRRPPDLLHVDQLVHLPTIDPVITHASATILRQRKRRDDAASFFAGYRTSLTEARDAEMGDEEIGGALPMNVVGGVNTAFGDPRVPSSPFSA